MCKQKALIWLAWEILRDLYRSPLTGKLHFSKEFLCFQNQELWHMFSLCFLSRVFNLSIKNPRFQNLHLPFSKAPTIESIIFILSATCIVPKYYIVFCMLVILLV